MTTRSPGELPAARPLRGESPVAVPVMRLAHGRGLPLPAYATAHAAGMDLLAAIDGERQIAPGDRALVPTGLALALPPGFEAQIRPRSGLAWEHGLTVLNSPGTIDADYRGEVAVVLVNLGRQPVTLRRGMRIAQMVVARHAVVTWDERSAAEGAAPGAGLDATMRGGGGFGSTGRD
jgi:dUTP pyrophosphatase